MKTHQDAVLSLPRTGGLQFLSAEILPWHGMTIYQIRAWLPALGEVDLLDPPHLDRPSSAAGGLLIPFANRLRGAAVEDGATIEANILGRRVRIPTNWGRPDAERLAIHGFILDSEFENLDRQEGDGHAGIRADLNAGNYGGRWLSSTKLTVEIALRHRSFTLSATALNQGDEPAPIGIGWHPNFRYPSGRRDQVILTVPAAERAAIDNYRDCFPDGRLIPVAGSEFDFSQPGGSRLGSLYLDDCFTALQRDDSGAAVSTLTDPAAGYRLAVKAISPEISAIQVYAPQDRGFVAIEPQFNRADPFAPVWGEQNTGMVILDPGQSVEYRVELELREIS